MKFQKAVAFFLGSFDPPHDGHATAVKALLSVPGVGEVWIVPTGERELQKDGSWVAPNKAVVRGKFRSTVGSRVEMCRLFVHALANSRVKLFEGYALEERHVSTLKALEFAQRRFPSSRFRLVVGSDLNPLAYSDSGEICKRFKPLIVSRKGAAFDGGGSAAGKDFDLVELPHPSSVSSTEIREKLARGEAVQGLLPDEVLAYALREKLYA